jgi:ferrous iron transport protein B
MGLTYQSTQSNAMTDLYRIDKEEGQFIIALAGNPNTGKSTVFNAITGLHQHTGNWPGKTVVNARGEFRQDGKENILVDLPGTYSLFASSVEEEVARDFICFGNADAVIVVTDATCLERSLNLVFQVMELTSKVVLCINLIDEAKKRHIKIDARGIEKDLGVPVVLCAARSGIGVDKLKETAVKVAAGEITPKPVPVKYDDKVEELIKKLLPDLGATTTDISVRWMALRMLDGDEKLLSAMSAHMGELSLENTLPLYGVQEELPDKETLRDGISEAIYRRIEDLKAKYIQEDSEVNARDKKIDNIITSKRFGLPIMLLALALVFWITVTGANIPSALLANFLFHIEDKLTELFAFLNAPAWLHGVLVLGLYRTLAWVVSVMLPPMAIFFPLFTILEDLGFLPRVAFNMDHLFKKACAHGKQCLTMIMGFGCNAAGIVSCRIIESPRERMIAILTNNFVPCNGRFPTLIAISSVFLVAFGGNTLGILPALAVTAMIVIGIVVTLLVSYLLSKTVLKGIPSTFTLELPPYRVPKIGRVLYTSMIDRSVFVLKRAVVVAAPAGAVIWILANIFVGDISILGHMVNFFDPFGRFIGLDGYILMAFLLGLPANEIVLPILLMAYLSTGSMAEYDSLESLRNILVGHGWTYLTALNTMLFSLLHWPCATTLITIRKETGSVKWTIVSALLPTIIAIVVCLCTTVVYRLVGLLF